MPRSISAPSSSACSTCAPCPLRTLAPQLGGGVLRRGGQKDAAKGRRDVASRKVDWLWLSPSWTLVGTWAGVAWKTSAALLMGSLPAAAELVRGTGVRPLTSAPHILCCPWPSSPTPLPWHAHMPLLHRGHLCTPFVTLPQSHVKLSGTRGTWEHQNSFVAK